MRHGNKLEKYKNNQDNQKLNYSNIVGRDETI